MTEQRLCGQPHYQHPETLCTEPVGHYVRDRDPHAGPLIIDGQECGGLAWDEPKDTPMTSDNAPILNNPGENFTAGVKGPAGLRDRVDAAISKALDDDPMDNLTDLQARLTEAVLTAIPATGADREVRLRISVLPEGSDVWRIWRRSPLTPQRAYDEAVAVERNPNIAQVRIDRTTITHEHITIADLHAELVAQPPAYGEMT
jgi:hypothetical protein